MGAINTAAFSAAAATFAEALTRYTRLAELFLQIPMTSARQVERADATLTSLVAAEERLLAAGQELDRLKAELWSQQSQLAGEIEAHIPEVATRTQRVAVITGELATVTGELGAVMAGPRGAAAPNRPDLSTAVRGLCARTEKVIAHAREAELADLEAEGRTLQQRLVTLGQRFAKAEDEGAMPRRR